MQAATQKMAASAGVLAALLALGRKEQKAPHWVLASTASSTPGKVVVAPCPLPNEERHVLPAAVPSLVKLPAKVRYGLVGTHAGGR